MSHSYQTYFGFPGSDLNLDYGLRDHVITRFASVSIYLLIFVHKIQETFMVIVVMSNPPRTRNQELEYLSKKAKIKL